MATVPDDVLIVTFSGTLSYNYPVQLLLKFLANKMEIKNNVCCIIYLGFGVIY